MHRVHCSRKKSLLNLFSTKTSTLGEESVKDQNHDGRNPKEQLLPCHDFNAILQNKKKIYNFTAFTAMKTLLHGNLYCCID